MVDPWVALSAIALSTRRIRIGTTVTPLPRRRPWKLAREAASVDHLSGGRLILGVGIGGGEAEWGAFSEETDLRKRGAMLDEALEILVGLWSGKRFHFEGAHYSIKETFFLPTPLQKPRIPIWVGAVWPNKPPLRRAASWDGVFPLFDAEEVEEELTQLEEVVHYCLKQGSPEQGWDVVCMGVTPEDRAAAAAMVYAEVSPASRDVDPTTRPLGTHCASGRSIRRCSTERRPGVVNAQVPWRCICENLSCSAQS